ncbi:MAG TPA: aminodeoxychorismate/anthranilate synthase component II [Bacteroidales bacterium]|nr:aminodeoxychorismate/anthranilate synthase component II [Bacteroidales bacterium]
MKKILVIDNYDSFTYNLVHYIHRIHGHYPDVYRNDGIDLASAEKYDKILLSPGPGIPVEAGICLDLIRELGKKKSILGVCLGHQAIGEAYGGTLANLSQVFHGLATPVAITSKEEPLFSGLPVTFTAGRYHSWVVTRENLPECFTITCEDENGTIMGISHKRHDVRGVQFHPESVLTEHGYEIMKNWLNL